VLKVGLGLQDGSKKFRPRLFFHPTRGGEEGREDTPKSLEGDPRPRRAFLIWSRMKDAQGKELEKENQLQEENQNQKA